MNTTQRRPILLFDVMETLVAEPFFEVIPQLFGMSREELLKHKHPTSWIEFESGQIDEDEYYRRFFNDGRQIDGALIRQGLFAAYRWLDGMEPLLRELFTAGYEMHALSNYSSWYELIEEAVGLSRYVRWTFVSYLTGLRKPDPQAYLYAAKTLQVQPAECLFVDDREVNVASAREVGMDVILRTDTEQLRRELMARGILAISSE